MLPVPVSSVLPHCAVRLELVLRREVSGVRFMLLPDWKPERWVQTVLHAGAVLCSVSPPLSAGTDLRHP